MDIEKILEAERMVRSLHNLQELYYEMVKSKNATITISTLGLFPWRHRATRIEMADELADYILQQIAELKKKIEEV